MNMCAKIPSLKTTPIQMNKDSSQRFIFEKATVRGEIVHLNASYKTIMNQRAYPPLIQLLLGEALVSCALLAGSIKFEGEISIQFQGDERFPLMLVHCDHELHLRAYAKFQEGTDIAFEDAFLNGTMVITINQNKQTQTYQSIVPIQSTSMAENLMGYLAQSEQIPSHVWMAVNNESAAGMLLQRMPEKASQPHEEFWNYAVTLGATITPDELLSLDNTTLLHRLYHEAELRLFEPRFILFRCTCNKNKIKHALQGIGEKEVQSIIDEKGVVETHCQFCNKQYLFDPIDAILLFKE